MARKYRKRELVIMPMPGVEIREWMILMDFLFTEEPSRTLQSTFVRLPHGWRTLHEKYGSYTLIINKTNTPLLRFRLGGVNAKAMVERIEPEIQEHAPEVQSSALRTAVQPETDASSAGRIELVAGTTSDPNFFKILMKLFELKPVA